MEYPGTGGVKTLSSVTSTCIQKVSLIYLYRTRGPSWLDITWQIFDAPLCQLIDQSRCTLEVDFRIVGARGVQRVECSRAMVIVDSLVGFREKGGQIRVVHVGSGGSESVLYPPPPPPVE